ncbi:MAG: sigma-54-dependent Fis family transcriptional regulator [Acidobacteria bacterium]|nr:sigma-54-dependent Fis family transcriptional regulator [Acidobacteriota bacterium]
MRTGLDNSESLLRKHDQLFRDDLSRVARPELEESYRRLVLLYELGRQICSENDETKVVSTILSAVSRLLTAERGFLALREGGQLKAAGCFGMELGEDAATWTVSHSMLRRVVESGEAVLTTDAGQDASFGKSNSVDLHQIRSVVCCPLGREPAVRGLIYVDNRMSRGAFSESDLEFLTALSHYALLAVESAETHRRIGAARELAEARWRALREESREKTGALFSDARMVELHQQTVRAARSDAPVVLVGETGTGKEVFARLIHQHSRRSAGPFVAVHAGALAPSVVESELFGHEKGAFTGAHERRMGRFELAAGGTLFLDEVQDIPLEVQVKLLRVLEQRTFERVGGNRTVEADVRLVCACNRKPQELVDCGRLRQDLYYRLNVICLEIPPLRERGSEVALLARHFLERCGSNKRLTPDAEACLAAYPWPGNVRELRNAMEALVAMVDGDLIRSSDLPARMRDGAGGNAGSGVNAAFEPLGEVVTRVEREHLQRALELAGGNAERAIRMLHISRAKFFQRKKEFGL